jgi:ADP-ribose pyrophosphatase YjhB (NUDIX family)
MKYCSECGSAMSHQRVAREARDRDVCTSCGTIHYQNPRIIVCCIVHWHQKILLCRRADEPARGEWVVPAGFLECGETLEEGAARETLEETGVVVDPSALDLGWIINMTGIHQVAIAFRVNVVDLPDLRPGPECLEAAFVSADELPNKVLAWRASLGDGPQIFFQELQSGDFTIQLQTLGSEQGIGFKSRGYKVQSIASRIYPPKSKR